MMEVEGDWTDWVDFLRADFTPLYVIKRSIFGKKKFAEKLGIILQRSVK